MPLILGTNSIKDTGYNVDNSCRFDDGDNTQLKRTAGTPTNANKGTFSAWVKRSNLVEGRIVMTFTDGNKYSYFKFNSDHRLELIAYSGGSLYADYKTNRLFRDVSAWYHIMLVIDTTQGTATNRMKFYVNGVQETSFNTQTFNGGQNTDHPLLIASPTNYHTIASAENAQVNFNGYMAEVVLLDGQALDATSFGEFDDSGIWKPIDVSGLTFGDNGYYLDFESSGSLGSDVSGNSNNFTVNNLTAIDQSTDTCTNNSCVINSLDNYYFGGTFSNGNITALSNSSGYSFCTSTMGVSSGKWYVEAKWDSGTNLLFGVTGQLATSNTQGMGNVAGSIAYASEGARRLNGAYTASWGDTYSTGDILSIALDLDNNKAYFAKNGTYQNSSNPSTGSNGETITSASDTVIGSYFFGFSDNSSSATSTVSFNFGSPSFSISSGNTDGNGYGNMEFAIPSGYFCLNSKNLAEYG